jgi:mycoredoxin
MFTRQPTRTYRVPGRSSVPVVVYGTSWCAASQMVRRYLDRLGIPYIYRDMEYDTAAARQVRWWTGGSFSHPTVQVGGQVLVEPSLDELDWALSRVGIF